MTSRSASRPPKTRPVAFAVEVEARPEVDRERQRPRETARLGRVVHPAALAVDRKVETCERGDLPRPDAGCADDRLRVDAPARRLDRLDAAVMDVDPGRRLCRFARARRALRAAATQPLTTASGVT